MNVWCVFAAVGGTLALGFAVAVWCVVRVVIGAVCPYDNEEEEE